MIELNNKTQQDFLNREWVQKLLDAGVDMSDAKYYIAKNKWDKDDTVIRDWVTLKECLLNTYYYDYCPTYTVSELIYKLYNEEGYFAEFNEYLTIPFIEYLASLLIQCHQKDIGLKTKDTGNISDK